MDFLKIERVVELDFLKIERLVERRSTKERHKGYLPCEPGVEQYLLKDDNNNTLYVNSEGAQKIIEDPDVAYKKAGQDGYVLTVCTPDNKKTEAGIADGLSQPTLRVCRVQRVDQPVHLPYAEWPHKTFP
jgi:hypothetical protein